MTGQDRTRRTQDMRIKGCVHKTEGRSLWTHKKNRRLKAQDLGQETYNARQWIGDEGHKTEGITLMTQNRGQKTADKRQRT